MPHKVSDARSLRDRLIGSRAFYAMVLAVVIPIIIQNTITSFVNLLDNIMVGQVGTEPMSGVSIANQLLFVFNLCVFGGLSGAGIFSAQFHGADNYEGVRQCFRYKLYTAAVLTALALAVFTLGGRALVTRYLQDEPDAARVDVTLTHALAYLRIMLFSLLPFALTQVYASTLRETGETRLPMYAGIAAVFVNLAFNYLLIFGRLGLPRLGVEGAAIATVISRFVELFIVVYFTHARRERFRFARGLYGSWRVPLRLVKDITLKGMPLLLNEGLWSAGMAVLTQCYSVRGLDVVAAMNICTTISNLFLMLVASMGSATAILVGQSLGANDLSGAMDRAWKLAAFSIALSVVSGLMLCAVAPIIPRVYRTSDEVRALAVRLMRVFALCLPLMSFCNSAYFTLRSGGKTIITFLFDSGYTWLIGVPIAWCLVHLTSLPVVTIFLCVQLADIIKCAFGFILMKKGVWLNNMVAQ